jgi:hypothetical protein
MMYSQVNEARARWDGFQFLGLGLLCLLLGWTSSHLSGQGRFASVF